jgi:hypothetical protein
LPDRTKAKAAEVTALRLGRMLPLLSTIKPTLTGTSSCWNTRILDLPIFENVKIVFLQARNKIALRVARGYVEHDEVHVDRDRAVPAESAVLLQNAGQYGHQGKKEEGPSGPSSIRSLRAREPLSLSA